MPKGAVLAVSHGGGPLPLLNDPQHADIISSLRTRAPRILSLDSATPPRAIVVVTAHWQTDRPTVSSAASPPLLYDYSGFPPETYEFKYPAQGSPAVAAEAFAALAAAGLDPALDSDRGWDHGVFVPLMLIRPQADIPIVAVSVLASESPEDHLRMGRALGTLRDSNVAIIGSGFASFHNFGTMMQLIRSGSEASDSAAASTKRIASRVTDWNALLVDALNVQPRALRDATLSCWRDLPGSYDVHPRGKADHFLPLLVSAGAADTEEMRYYKDRMLRLDILSFYWGGRDVTG